jgi:hypothetical protein
MAAFVPVMVATIMFNTVYAQMTTVFVEQVPPQAAADPRGVCLCGPAARRAARISGCADAAQTAHVDADGSAGLSALTALDRVLRCVCSGSLCCANRDESAHGSAVCPRSSEHAASGPDRPHSMMYTWKVVRAFAGRASECVIWLEPGQHWTDSQWGAAGHDDGPAHGPDVHRLGLAGEAELSRAARVRARAGLHAVRIMCAYRRYIFIHR